VPWSTFELSPSKAQPRYRARIEFTDIAQQVLEQYSSSTQAVPPPPLHRRADSVPRSETAGRSRLARLTLRASPKK
jgi:hypothetical protein